MTTNAFPPANDAMALQTAGTAQTSEIVQVSLKLMFIWSDYLKSTTTEQLIEMGRITFSIRIDVFFIAFRTECKAKLICKPTTHRDQNCPFALRYQEIVLIERNQ